MASVVAILADGQFGIVDKLLDQEKYRHSGLNYAGLFLYQRIVSIPFCRLVILLKACLVLYW